MKRPLIAAFIGLLMCVGCAENVVYQADQQVPSTGWTREWKPAFAFDINDTVSPQDVYLDIRHTGDYPFSNLYTFVSLTGPDQRTHTDTVECVLADPTGRWYGKGTGFVLSDRHAAKVLYKLRNRFPRKGRYSFTIEQAMRTDTLVGVIDIGVSIERSAKGS